MSEYSPTIYFIRIIAKILAFGGMVIFVLGYWIVDSFWLGAGIGTASYIIGVVTLSVTDNPIKCPYCHNVNVKYVSEINKDGMLFKGHGWECHHCGKGFDGEYKANIGGQIWTIKW